MKKLTKKQSLIVKTCVIIASVLFFLVCTMAVINRFAPANPKSYHVWFLSTFGGSFDNKKCPNTYWEVETLADGNDVLTTYVNLELLKGNEETKPYLADIKSVYVNLSDLPRQVEDFEITAKYGSTDTYKSTVKITQSELKQSKLGWFEIDVKDAFKAFTYVTSFDIGFSTQINVREIVIVNKKDVVLHYKIKSYTQATETKTLESIIEEHEEKPNNTNFSIYNLNDEQNKFPYATYKPVKEN